MIQCVYQNNLFLPTLFKCLTRLKTSAKEIGISGEKPMDTVFTFEFFT
jgi:hypothetical protein